ncbi:arylesterase [Hwanghaeella grinnelliae]|uniref:arylesterase n=1 Tax=Hwanghaeella grinnelliae TaxID=2500179 RepID=UPI001F016CEA|nr:arylesterase [Hwanghaeella grinnelliae]
MKLSKKSGCGSFRHRNTDHKRYGGIFGQFNRFAAVFLFLASLLAGPQVTSASEEPVILAFGDSLTAGYGLPQNDSFPAQLSRALASAGHPAKVINAGVSGDTSAGGANRIDWALADEPDLVILELGANDGLRGFEPAQTRKNLDIILEKSFTSGAKVLFTGMLAPRNLGNDYAAEFDAVFPDMAEKYPNAVFYPFFLEGVAADPKLNQDDGIHPNAEGVAVIVERIMPFVLKALGKDA